MAYNLREAGTGSTVDKVDAQLNKAISAVQKAQNAVLDAADALDAVMVDAIACGGKVAEIVPQHIKTHIASLTQIADQQLGGISEGENQSSLTKLKDLIGNIPYRDLRQPDAAARRADIAGQPNLAGGPQSAVSAQTQVQESEDFQEFYRNYLREEPKVFQPKGSVLSFENLKESSIFGNVLDNDMMGAFGMKVAQPIQPATRIKIQEKMRAAANDQMFEDVDNTDRSEERLQEGSFFSGALRAFGGSDGMPLSFSGLSEGGHIVGGQ